MTSLSASLPLSPKPFLVFLRRRQNVLTFALAFIIYATLNYLILRYSDNPPIRFRLDATRLIEASFILKAHVAGALTCLAIGVVLMVGRKGRTAHRVLGYSWVAAMTVTAVTSFFLTGLNGDKLSFIHLLSVWTLIALPMGLAAARARKIKSHGKQMTGIFVRGMLIAGLFSFMPGRMMWSIFFGI